MIFIKAIDITDAMLVSSTVAEPSGSDPLAWASPTNYALGALAYRAGTHRVYKRIVAGATGTPPEQDIAGYPGVTAPNWKDYLPTNRWAMFDAEVNTQSVQASGDMVITVAPGELADSLVLLEAEADEVEIEVTDGAAGPVVYTRTVDMVTSVVTDAYEYCFEPFTRSSTLVLRDLPPYLNAHITVTLRGPAPVKLGALRIGTGYFMGRTTYGAQAGAQTTSKTVIDEETSVIRLSPGKVRKTMRLQMEVDNGAVNQVSDLFEKQLGRVGVWLGVETVDLKPFVVDGFILDYFVAVTEPTMSIYSVEIQGMT